MSQPSLKSCVGIVIGLFVLCFSLGTGFAQRLDFGDAPEKPYPTTTVMDGARHVVDDKVYLGKVIDSERDGQPNATATGDDVGGEDDEDGLVDLSELKPGWTCNAMIFVTGKGLLSAWIDFNNDGDWDDTGEKIFDDEVVSSGYNSLGFPVPADARAVTTFARFRISTQEGLLPTGLASDGEVEDYQVRIVSADLDWGDAPDKPYPTWVNSNGARHIIVEDLALGEFADPDKDGQPDANAMGDDKDGSDDEDGVEFGSIMAGRSAAVKVAVRGNALLHAWMDFNGDGDWNDPNERIFANRALTTGVHELTYFVPLDAADGETFARFRYSHDRGLTPTGLASDGEVEDYQVNINPPDYDFGDAPDKPYPTLHANGGAYHVIMAGLSLGDKIDADNNGQPNADATGDDVLDGNDDEDGVQFTTDLYAGQPAKVTVKIVGEGFLHAWIDYNKNGDWTDAGEQLFADLALSAGTHTLNYHIPTTAVLGKTFARFRLSREQGLKPSGMSVNGEVEDYQVEILAAEPELDWGDAPDSKDSPGYPTLLIHDGARHLIQGPWLGDRNDSPDAEADGLPDPDALGDDNKDKDDENGVTIPVLIKGLLNDIEIEVSGGGGFVRGWIDFDQNRQWQDWERVVDANLADGRHTITFDVPERTVPGQTFARFRISRQGAIDPTGAAQQGEVEDYQVAIEEMDRKVKWIQYPELRPRGIDIDVTGSNLVADDWPCTFPSLLTDVHIWGSWIGDQQGVIESLVLTIYSDDPVGVDGEDPKNEYSMPDKSLWTKTFKQNEIIETKCAIVQDPGEYWWSVEGELIPGGDTEVWRLDMEIPPDEAFRQEGTEDEPTIYWLCVNVQTENKEHRFGWKTRQWPDHFMDDAVWAYDDPGARPQWVEMRYPPEHPYFETDMNSIDMAFALTFTGIETEQLDWGDAPDGPYHTLLARNGARHTIVPGLFLGEFVEPDPDGQPNAEATGDDGQIDGDDDEDGVHMHYPWTVGEAAKVTVIASARGFLNVWIDYDNNGSWSEADNLVFEDEELAPGGNDLTFNIPAGAVADSTFARFRFCSQKGVKITGHALDGEVEDYRIALTASPVGIDKDKKGLPTDYALSQNYPNPFNPGTEIAFQLPTDEWVRLEVFNVKGQRVITLVDGHIEAGSHTVLWQAHEVPSGVYMYRIRAGKFTAEKKMLLMK